MAWLAAPFVATYWLHILSALLCFLLGNVFSRAFTVSPSYGRKRRHSSVADADPSLESPPYDEDSLPRVPYSLTGYDDGDMVQRSEQFYRDMNTRRSVRAISDKPVPIEVIENCLRTAGTAPSGAHKQPWTFAVISSPEVKLNVRHVIEEEERINYEKRMSQQWLADLEKIGTTWLKPYLTRAPYVIIVFKQQFAVSEEGEKKTHYYQEISASIATGFLLLALHNAGLVTVTTTPMNAGPRLRAMLDRPAGEKVLVLLPVGHPEDDATVPNLRRKALGEIMVLKD